jgi:16S rRNA processing protein RimM
MTLRETEDEVVVGRIAGVFGIRGEVKCDPTSAGRIVFALGATLRCEREEESSEIRLASIRPHKGRLLVRIEGVDGAQSARAYSGAVLYALRRDVRLNAGEYLDADLVGCLVRGVDGAEYGAVERVEHYPASDMLVVAGHLVPMVGAIVREIDMARRSIVIDPPAGLCD